LALLKQSGENYCSGEKMSQTLGLSRAAVWKAVDALRQDGYHISSAPNRGYRLERSPDRLSAGELSGALTGCTVGRELICLDSVDSTNNYAKALADQGAAHGTVVLSDCQTGGRGRRGNSFLSPAGKGLYLSALLRPQLPPARVIDLTAWVAVAICDALEQVTGERPGIKWTNDIILREKKVCGILTELSVEGESGALNYVVTGIGVNISQTDQDFGPDVAQVAISLEQALGRSVRRADLAAALIRALDRLSRDFPEKKQDYLERYRADCLTTGHEVRLVQKGETRTAFAESIDDDFALVVRWPDGAREAITAGDVSVRGLLGYV
jgi:BirA family biotin operon repressor/biotin-[acetyl-CoA-carboxylase] ligase